MCASGHMAQLSSMVLRNFPVMVATIRSDRPSISRMVVKNTTFMRGEKQSWSSATCLFFDVKYSCKGVETEKQKEKREIRKEVRRKDLLQPECRTPSFPTAQPIFSSRCHCFFSFSFSNLISDTCLGEDGARGEPADGCVEEIVPYVSHPVPLTLCLYLLFFSFFRANSLHIFFLPWRGRRAASVRGWSSRENCTIHVRWWPG
jgi:hypothetical protein